jgi:chorismate synthase
MGELRFMTAGESHGRGLVAVLEGMVAGLAIDEGYIARDLRRRQGGYGRGERMKIEDDHAEIFSGVRHGFTLGSPISLLIWNRDWGNWQEEMAVAPTQTEPKLVTLPRPGHADLPGAIKYGLKDVRPVIERSSARETAARVAAGAVAKRFLEEFGIWVRSRVVAIGGVEARRGPVDNWDVVENSPVRCADTEAGDRMMKAIDSARRAGDTVGGSFEVLATGLPPGLGSHVQWDRRLDGLLAQALMSIQAVKGVLIGDAKAQSSGRGSAAHDAIFPNRKGHPYFWKRPTNHAGGIEGGMTNGEPLSLTCLVKPIASLKQPLDSIDLRTGHKTGGRYERSDVCMVPAAGVVGEAMTALTLAAALLEKFGGDNLTETLDNHHRFIDRITCWKE